MKQIVIYNFVTGVIIIGIAFGVLARNYFVFSLATNLLIPINIVVPVVGGYLINKFHWISLQKNSFWPILGHVFGLTFLARNSFGSVPQGIGQFIGTFLVVLVFTFLPLLALTWLGQTICDMTNGKKK